MVEMEVKYLIHRAQECMGLYLPKEEKIQTILQHELNARWSRTHHCWYLLLNKTNYQNLITKLSGKVILTRDDCKDFLSKKETDPVPLPESESTRPSKAFNKDNSHHLSRNQNGLSIENRQAWMEYKNQLILKGYSPNTIRTYCNEFQIYLQTLKKRSAEKITTGELRRYFLYCIQEMKLRENTVHSRMNALKFYYEQVLHRDKIFFEIPRPKKPDMLPKVISKERIADLINSIENLKHKAIIMLTYACGLRVSEVVALKVKHIDGQRKVLFVEKGKGKKDRVISLTPSMLIVLREYYKQYRPKEYLFEGQGANDHLSQRSIQQVMQKAKKKAGIIQDGNMHLLRHSFATHLLDKGIDVVFIQKILGHNNIKTTLRYLHVSNKDLVQIISPLEDIEKLLKK